MLLSIGSGTGPSSPNAGYEGVCVCVCMGICVGPYN